MSKLSIDGIDKSILRFLIKDARTPVLEIARNIGISGAAIHQRLKKLENSGLIAGSKFIINPKALGYTTMAFVGVFIKILCKDNMHLMSVLNKGIQEISGISRTETYISLNQQIDRQIKI